MRRLKGFNFDLLTHCSSHCSEYGKRAFQSLHYARKTVLQLDRAYIVQRKQCCRLQVSKIFIYTATMYLFQIKRPILQFSLYTNINCNEQYSSVLGETQNFDFFHMTSVYKFLESEMKASSFYVLSCITIKPF